MASANMPSFENWWPDYPIYNITSLRKAVQEKPSDRALRNKLGVALTSEQNWAELYSATLEWLPWDPENPQVFEFLANSANGLNDTEKAMRAASSIGEVAPTNSAYLDRAGWLLVHLGEYETAKTYFHEALMQREDNNHNTYRGLAFTHWLLGEYRDAVDVLENAWVVEKQREKERTYYGDVLRVVKEEQAYIYNAWLLSGKLTPEETYEVLREISNRGVNIDYTDTLRVTIQWETDATDVDLHVVDPAQEECYYAHKNTATGLNLYSDQVRGLGPEVIVTSSKISGVYSIGVKLYSAGALGTSRGVVVVLIPDEKGFVARPIVQLFSLLTYGYDDGTQARATDSTQLLMNIFMEGREQ